jgi:hypothetical protein
LKKRNKDIIYDKFVKKLKDVLIGTISFNIIAVDENNKTHQVSVDEFLLKVYEMYHNVNINILNKRIEKVNCDISELNILKKIRPSLSSTLRNKLNYNDSIDYIHDKTKIDKDKIKSMLSKYKITKLLNLDTDTTGLENKKNDLENNLKNIDLYVINQYDDIIQK